MKHDCSRRTFLVRTGMAAAGIQILPGCATCRHEADDRHVDFHVHLDKSTLDKVLELSAASGVRFGIVEHAGTRENVYPKVLSNDQELGAYVDMLAGKPVFKGIQAEWIDWGQCFSRAALRRLDYVLTDTMTFPGRNGERVKLWEPGAESRIDVGDKQVWMDHFVNWHLKVLDTPIDVLANTSWLPPWLANDYEQYWTEARVRKVAAAAVKRGVAMEISSKFNLPKASFLQAARKAGVKFSLGSNGRYPQMGKLDYSLAVVRELGLKKSEMFFPSPRGPRAARS